MPRGDGTGPMGMGSMTGRGTGDCNGFALVGYMNPVGFGGGFGHGRGVCRMFYAPGIPKWVRYGYPAYSETNTAAFDEKTFLSNQAEFLENQLQQVKKRLSSLGGKIE